MTSNSGSDKGDTLLIKRSPKIKTDERGHTVWVGEIEDADFELVSTTHVKTILESGDEEKIDEIRRIAATGSHGVLIQDCNDGHFDVLDSANLDKLMQDPDPPVDATSETDAELELMETRVLRKILVSEGQLNESEIADDDGSDPYNSGSATDSSWK